MSRNPAGHAIGHGTRRSHFGEIDCLIKFETSQPAPTQWIAVGRAETSLDREGDLLPRMVVGAGRSEAAAVKAMEERCPIHGKAAGKS
ncbi:MAG TPA: hypothetical protein VKU87_04570 [Thermomicrobiaceae bacterium]|nr:hypothetical protein [Thermomicrobiaceae bacterium]